MSGLAEILDENARLREALAALHNQMQALETDLREKDDALRQRDARIEALKASAEALAQRLALIDMKARGPASERFIPDSQTRLAFPSEITPPPRAPRPEPEPEEPSSKKTLRRGTPRRRNRENFKHLPSRPVTCRASSDAKCAACGGDLRVIGQATSFRVEWVPGHFIVEDVVRDKCACSLCPGEGVLTVPGPYALDRALCGDSLLARILVDKFVDHIPLNRQARRMEREGFEVGSNTLASWTKQGASLLSVLARAVRRDLLTKPFLLGDDTGFPVQDGEDGQLRKGRLWVFTDQEQAFYAFTDTKQGVFPAALLEGFAGDLRLVDGGSEFNRVVRELDLERAGCWSHLRRYFFDARLHHPVEATLALGTIRDLFVLDREFHGKPPDERRALRQARAAPLVDGFFDWVRALSTAARPKSSLGEALTYARNQEAEMRLFLEHGALPMHNNLSELLLRQPVVGRKNWLFARSEGGATAAADVYTLVGSCMLQGIDPHAYLVDVLGRLPDHPSNRVGELTPKAWRLERERRMAGGG